MTRHKYDRADAHLTPDACDQVARRAAKLLPECVDVRCSLGVDLRLYVSGIPRHLLEQVLHICYATLHLGGIDYLPLHSGRGKHAIRTGFYRVRGRVPWKGGFPSWVYDNHHVPEVD